MALHPDFAPYEPPLDEVFERANGNPRGHSGKPRPPARLKSIKHFLDEYVPLDYALEPIIRTGSLYTLTARTGAGKTAWLISVALAIAAGRGDVLGTEVERGRVALLTFENADDVRMRIKVACWFLRIEVDDLLERLLILDTREKPEEVLARLKVDAQDGPLRLVLVDTLAAFFDGDNINDAVQGGGFMRRLRPITRLPGLPAVVVAAHPVKNAPQDNLLPYGSGAILNEVDGNLTLWRRSEGTDGVAELHWQGKLRGLEFAPMQFRFEATTAPTVRDAKGREVALPVMLPCKTNGDDIEAKAKAETNVQVALLKAMIAKPQATQREWAEAISRSVSTINGKLKKLQADKLVELVMDHPRVTPKGEKEADRWP